MILKSDQEPSTMALKRFIKERLKDKVMMEESPVGEHQANGSVENAVRRVQGMCRTAKHTLEARCGMKTGGYHCVAPWV